MTPSLFRRFEPVHALIVASVLVPALLFAFAAWKNQREILRETNLHVVRTVRILQEHAIKVFETHRLVIDRVNERLGTMDWTSDTARAGLHELLKRLQDDLDQIATITVTDDAGRMIGSSRVYPADPAVTFADRDWFQALRQNKLDRPYVSRSYTGRQSGQSVFNVADRIGSANGTFVGAVAISVDRAYFETFYRGVESEFDHSVTLFRDDAVLLAREPVTRQTALAPTDALFAAVSGRAPSGAFEAYSQIDGTTGIFGFSRLEPYPVVVGFGISRDSALAVWRRNLVDYGLIAALSSLALLAISGLAIRQTRRERLASARWQEAAELAQAESVQRLSAEEQLRQSQKMEAVGRLTGGVAHDFNNLLTIVLGSLDLLARRATELTEKNAKLVSNASEGARRAAALTHRLLAFSRQQPLAPRVIDVNKLVSGMSEILQRTIGENIQIETVLAAGLWRTIVDPNQLESALVNLAVNARDSMPGGGRLTIETSNARLDDAYVGGHAELKSGQYVMIAVCDTGSGMSPEVTARAFDPFFTTKAVGQGTGLGLSQVYGFAKQSGGHAAIYSELGEGTTIKLYLPRSTNPLVPLEDDALSESAALQSGRGETILVVEDEPAVRALSTAVLAEAGYRVIEAGDWPDGLAALRSNPDVSLLFTDVVLTGPMNGRQVADEALKLRPDLKVLFTTGYTRNAIVHHGRLDEDVHFIGKPFTAVTLLAKIRALLDAPA